MKCSIQGCPGEYETRKIVHILTYNDMMYVFDHVPAEVCFICGETLLKPETIRTFERRMKEKKRPARFAPVYEFA